MNTIFMNSKNSEASDPNRLLLILQVKLAYKENINILVYQILAFTMHAET